MSETPHNNVLAKIVVGIVIAILCWAWTSLAMRVDSIQEKQSMGYQRLAKNDAEIAALREGMARIERKLDMVLETK